MASQWTKCPACDADVPANAHYCSNCGLVLREGSTGSERALETGPRPDRIQSVEEIEFLDEVGSVSRIDDISWLVAFKIAIAILIVSIVASGIGWFLIIRAASPAD